MFKINKGVKPKREIKEKKILHSKQGIEGTLQKKNPYTNKEKYNHLFLLKNLLNII